MKKFALLSAVLFVAAFILLPEIGNGKYNVSKPLVADGGPILPLPPNPSVALVADGNPMPPPIPPNPSAATLMADGNPMPPPIPPSTSLQLMFV